MKNIKRVLSIVISFLIIILIYQFIVILFSNKHEVTYELAIKDKLFTIKETYKKDANENGYYLNIKDDSNKEFIFYVENTFNKQKEIIKDIKYYEKDDYLCIYPIDIKNSNDFEILCNDGSGIYSYYYTNTKVDISGFLNELKLSTKYVDNKNDEEVINNVSFYKNNIYSNEYVELYHYKSLYLYHDKEVEEIIFSISDIYKNTLGAFINQYFLVPTIRDNRIIGYNIIDVANRDERKFEFNENVSTNSYVLGIANDKLYIFDLSNKLEIEISPGGSYTIIGSVDMGFKIYNKGEWISKSITEFTDNKITFNLEHDEDIKFEYDELYTIKNAHYIVDNNKLYKIYKNDLEKRILLLEFDEYSNIKVDNNRIYYISGEYLYRYDQYGIKTIVNNSEFKYNNTNIYHVYND